MNSNQRAWHQLHFYWQAFCIVNHDITAAVQTPTKSESCFQISATPVPIRPSEYTDCWAWWHIARFDTYRPKSRGFESRHAGTLDKSFTRSCMWRFAVKLRHSIHC